jgi:hypothetical protein
MRRSDTHNSFNEYDFITQTEEIPCLFNAKAGVLNYSADRADQITYTGKLFISEEVFETDRIYLLDDGFIYDVVLNGMIIRNDAVTGLISHYELFLMKREKYNEEEIKVTK